MHSYRRDVPRQFAKKPLAERLAEDLEGALQEADSRHVDDWSIESLEQHADEIVAAEALQPLEVRPAKKVVDDEQFLNPRERGGGVTELIAVKIPHNHHQGYFLFVPSNPPSKPLHADVDKKYVIFRYFASQDPNEVEHRLLSQTSLLVQWVEALNQDVEQASAQMRTAVLDRLRSRAAGRQQSRALIQALAIPTAQVPTERVVEIPATPRKARLAEPDEALGGWTLADDTYEIILDTVIRFGNAMGHRSQSAEQLVPDEETLRDWIVFMLNSNLEREDAKDMFVAGEAVNNSGKTDILTRQDGKNVFIGECKFWKGAVAFTRGLNQLLSYLGWRDVKAALILFIKDGNASEIIEKAHREILAHPNFVKESGQNNTGSERRDYVLRSSADAAVLVKLAFVPMVMTSA